MSELCLVTGGAGFIGSHLVEALTAAGKRVRVLDNFGTGQRSNLGGVRPAPEIIDGEIRDFSVVERAVSGVDVVFHLAAMCSVQFSLEDPVATHQVCATGTLNVAEAARRAKVRRVVYAGSSSAYGLGAALQKETDLPWPLSPYAAAKLAGEFYLQAFANSFGLETVRLRFFNVFGPRQRADSPYSGVIALFASAMAAGRAPTVLGDGLQTRDFIYVGDAVQALVRAADTPGIGGNVYNIGTGRGTTILELVEVLNRLLGTNHAPVFMPPRPGDVRHSRADIGRVRRELGYAPTVSLTEGLERTLEWYRKNH
jgi:nucleoside-diphosphate-sugar epimerase